MPDVDASLGGPGGIPAAHAGVAAAIDAAAGEGTLVATALPTGPTFAAVFERCWDAGAAVLPLPPEQPAGERERVLAAARPGVLVTTASVVTLADPLPVPDGAAVVLATSGSTGVPKLVVLPRAALVASATAGLQRLGAARGDRWLACLPAWHVGGLLVLIRSRLSDGRPILHERFEVAAVAAALGERVDHVAVVPTMLTRLLDAGVPIAGPTWLLGGSAAPTGLVERAALAGARVVQTYGMTETSGGCVYDGRPLDGVALRIDEEARILVSGPVLFAGYLGEPPRTGTWWRTPDIGRLDQLGNLEVLGRADDVVVSGGENVPAGRVAALLEEHPAVAEAAVAGRADAEWGQRVVAWCVATDPERPPTLGELREWVAARVGGSAAPRELVLLDALPRSPLGKVLVAALPDTPGEQLRRS